MSNEARFPSLAVCGDPDTSVSVPCAVHPRYDWPQAPGSDPHTQHPPLGPAVAMTYAPGGQATPTPPATLPEWAKWSIGIGAGLVVGYVGARVIHGE